MLAQVTPKRVARLTDIEVRGKRVVIRVDMNVPLDGAKISDEQRIRACLPTIHQVLQNGGAVILLSHLGRPEEGKFDDKFSLAVVAQRLSELLGTKVGFSRDYLDGVQIRPGEVLMCENVRFNFGEEKNDSNLAQRYAALGEVFVMDAFASAHRKHASTYGVIYHAKQSCMGLLLEKEITALAQVLQTPEAPVVVIVGGAKISSKMSTLHYLIEQADCLIVGGGIANMFLLAAGYQIGKSLCEPELLEQARQLLNKARQSDVNLMLPEDVVCADTLKEDAVTQVKSVDAVGDNQMIVDIGPITSLKIAQAIEKAGTVLWSGAVGCFEKLAFSNGTQRMVDAFSRSSAYSIAGGGDTVAAINQFHVASNISYISTGGGAFLKSLEGGTLPAIQALGEQGV